jgi:hypothetical protein
MKLITLVLLSVLFYLGRAAWAVGAGVLVA